MCIVLMFNTSEIKVPAYGSNGSKHAARYCMTLKRFCLTVHFVFISIKLLKLAVCKFSNKKH